MCRLFKRRPNLTAGNCVAGVKAVEVVSESTCWAQYCRGADCLSGVGTYLLVTVLQVCRLFKWCWDLPSRHCWAGEQSVSAVSEPTCRALCCRLFNRCWNILPMHCGTVVQAV